MKRILIILLICLPIITFAQDYILRAGREVYRFDDDRKCWTENPLPVNTPLCLGDSIKSYTQFTVEVPFSINKPFSKRVFTYIKYPRGIRLSEKLLEKKDCSTPVSTEVRVLGDKAQVEHIAWLINNSTSVHPYMDVTIDLYERASWSSITEDMNISKNVPVCLLIINGEAKPVYTYILCKDTKWTSLWSRKSQCISPFSFFEMNLSFREPLGENTLVVLASKDFLSENDIKELLMNLNNNNSGTFNASLQGKFYVASKHFKLTE